MDIKLTPAFLNGEINVPPSKSISHRALICAALADGESVITGLLDCEDTRATIDALTSLGAEITVSGNETKVVGIKKENITDTAEINCRESGSTLRFMLPVAAALGRRTIFKGEANLPNRPITPYIEQFPLHGVKFESEKMPYIISGKLTAGDHKVTGDISSQFITGYMLSLPLTGKKSRIVLTSPLQSRPYALLTTDVMRSFGVDISETAEGFTIPETAGFVPCNYTVEADMSQAAFFLVANAVGGRVSPLGLRSDSKQGDAVIQKITDNFSKNGGKAFDIDAKDIPDLVPILSVLACFADGTSHITGCGRLRIKESDRLAAMTAELNRLGGNVTADSDSLTIKGVKELHGGDCLTYSDHRIAMSLAVASQRCTGPVILRGADCVSKSYPEFFEDLKKIGGKADVL